MDNLGSPSTDLVYIGAWTNWSKGKVLGATVTLTQRNGNLLIAFIALFVTFVGTSFFRLLCFFIHLRYSSKEPRDAIHHQRQVLLRNSPSGLSVLWSLGMLLWHWGKSGRWSAKKVLPLVALAIACTSAFGVAGVYSSDISASAGKEVLLRSPHCGIQYVPKNTTLDDFTQIFQAYINSRAGSFRNYAQDCYSGTIGRNPRYCQTFVRPQLPRSVDTNASCPFDERICQSSNKNIRIDTGYLDSNDHFGINAPKDKRYQFRNVIHCAPLKLEGYTDTYNHSSGAANLLYQRYYYGPTIRKKNERNYTYIALDIAKDRRVAELLVGPSDTYSLGVLQNMIKTDYSNFDPIQELQRNDADVTVAFLSANSILFTEEVNDPLYSAHQPLGNLTSPFYGRSNLYLADQPASPLGCTSQYQLCIRNDLNQRECSLLDGLAAATPANLLNMSEEIQNFVNWTQGSLYGVYANHLFLNADSLASRLTLRQGIQEGALPDDQWQKDVRKWSDIYLAALQSTAVDSATGPASPEMRRFYQAPTTAEGRNICNNQKIRSTAFTNFSILGLIVTFSVGSLILLVYYSIEWVFERWFSKRCSSGQYAILEWKTNGALQLHRLAHEEIESGTWSKCDGDTPITVFGDTLAPLDIRDLEHPVLEDNRLKTIFPPSTNPPTSTGNGNQTPASSQTTVGSSQVLGSLPNALPVTGNNIQSQNSPQMNSPVGVQVHGTHQPVGGNNQLQGTTSTTRGKHSAPRNTSGSRRECSSPRSISNLRRGKYSATSNTSSSQHREYTRSRKSSKRCGKLSRPKTFSVPHGEYQPRSRKRPDQRKKQYPWPSNYLSYPSAQVDVLQYHRSSRLPTDARPCKFTKTTFSFPCSIYYDFCIPVASHVRVACPGV